MKRSARREPLSPTVFELIFNGISIALIRVLTAYAIEAQGAAAYIGTAGLRTVRRKILLYFLLRLCNTAAPLLCILFSGFLVHLIRRERLLPSRTRVLTGLLLCVPMFLTSIVHRTGFEAQCGQTDARGLRPMKMFALLCDVQRDLQESAAPAEYSVYAEAAVQRDSYRFGSGGRYGHTPTRHPCTEYVLRYSGEAAGLAQITAAEYQAAKGICPFAPHKIALYPHSGFIASFDGGEISVQNDYETLFTLTYSTVDNMLRRTVHPRESEMLALEIVVERGGEIIGRICPDHTTEQYFDPNMTGTRIWMEMNAQNQTVRVSNIITI